MRKRYRLTARAQMGGVVQDPGFEFYLEEDEKGPHRTVMISHDRVDVTRDNARILGEARDEPLYVEAPEA